MNHNMGGWPGEPPAELASTSTHDVLRFHHPTTPSLAGPAAKEKGKRARSALSCAECRRLKLKCSRTWPCTSCIKRKCAHICPDDVLKEVRPSRSKEVGSLQDRIRELEHQLAIATGQQPLSPLASAGLPSSHGHTGQDSLEPFGGPQADERHPGVSDVAEVMGTLLLGEDGSSRYLGKSAANAWFHDGASEDEEGSVGSGDDDEEYPLSASFHGTAFPMVSKGLEVQDFQAMLPPISEARALSHAYFTNCAFMYEPLQRAIFYDKHLPAAYTYDSEEQLITLEQLACVFMILALGVLFDLETDSRDPRSPKYHTIAQACLTSAKFLNIPSLASIQCLHLMATWQLTSHSQTGAFRAWPLLGLAGRIILSTGLHRDGSIWAIPEPDLSIRRSLFWELVCYDRLQGMILGRPYMISDKHFDTIMPNVPDGEPYSGESIEFHRYKYELCMIIGELCDDCFSIGRPNYDTILRHDRRLRQFKQSLPSWLRFDATSSASGFKPKPDSRELRQMLQQHTLAIKIHETLLFLHRVAFAQAIEHYPGEPLRSPWAQSVVSLCLEACRTLIAIARSAYHHYPRLAARWWHIQVHCFGAGVCFAAVCIKSPASALTRLAWSELCDAETLLESTSNEGLHARDLYPRLRKLRDQAQHKLETYQLSPGPIHTTVPGMGGVGTNGQPGSAGRGETMDSPISVGGSSSVGAREGSATGSSEEAKLAVLGATTRKLDGHHFPGRHAPSKSGAHAQRREREPSGQQPLALQQQQQQQQGQSSVALGTPQTQTLSIGQSIWQPNSVPASLASTYSPISPPSNLLTFATAGPSDLSGPSLGSGPGGSSSAFQTYENLDPALAEMLAAISGTTARETSAAFPELDIKNWLPANGAAGAGSFGVDPAVVGTPASNGGLMQHQLQQQQQQQLSQQQQQMQQAWFPAQEHPQSMSFDMTGAQPSPVFARPGGGSGQSSRPTSMILAPGSARSDGPSQPSQPSTTVGGSNSSSSANGAAVAGPPSQHVRPEREEEMFSSPGHEYFEIHPDEASIQKTLQEGLSPPPPGGPTGVLSLSPAPQPASALYQAAPPTQQPASHPRQPQQTSWMGYYSHPEQSTGRGYEHQQQQQQIGSPYVSAQPSPASRMFPPQAHTARLPPPSQHSTVHHHHQQGQQLPPGHGQPPSSQRYLQHQYQQQQQQGSLPGPQENGHPSQYYTNYPPPPHITPHAAQPTQSAGSYEPSGYRVYDDLLSSLSGYPGSQNAQQGRPHQAQHPQHPQHAQQPHHHHPQQQQQQPQQPHYQASHDHARR